MNDRATQRWGEKRYHSMDFDLKEQYGEKVYKVTLNGGMSCPNRDSTWVIPAVTRLTASELILGTMTPV